MRMLGFTVLALAGCTFAGTGGAAAAGVVHVDDDTGRPVAGATVRVFRPGAQRILHTDASGAVAADLTGAFQLRISAPGRASSQFALGDDTRGDVRCRLAAAREIVVRVVDEQGAGVAGQRVDAVPGPRAEAANSTLADRLVVLTDASGWARFDDAGDARYWISVPAWRQWSGTDLYGIEPPASGSAVVEARVGSRPVSERLEVVVRGLDAASWLRPAATVVFPSPEHPTWCVEVEGRSGLERIDPPDSAMVLGEPGTPVRVRAVATRAGERDPGVDASAWVIGAIGQGAALVVEIRPAVGR